jgi:hypothetical protein
MRQLTISARLHGGCGRADRALPRSPATRRRPTIDTTTGEHDDDQVAVLYLP